MLAERAGPEAGGGPLFDAHDGGAEIAGGVGSDAFNRRMAAIRFRVRVSRSSRVKTGRAARSSWAICRLLASTTRPRGFAEQIRAIKRFSEILKMCWRSCTAASRRTAFWLSDNRSKECRPANSVITFGKKLTLPVAT